MEYVMTTMHATTLKNLKLPFREYEDFITEHGLRNVTEKTTGTVDDDYFEVDNLHFGNAEIEGEVFLQFTMDILEKSTGYMKAIVIWNNGETIEEMGVLDGIVTFKPYL